MIFLVFVCATASAQVFKRVGPDGKVYFSDQPGPDARQIEVAPATNRRVCWERPENLPIRSMHANGVRVPRPTPHYSPISATADDILSLIRKIALTNRVG